MLARPLWQERIASAWQAAPVVWLTGVRRVGKTVLAKSLEKTEFLNCDLPSTAERLRDPEAFFASVEAPRVVLDEIHQLPDPSRILKIAADAFPKLKVLATGSSTFAATQKFRDSLAGRKRVVELVPVLAEELSTFGSTSIETRMLRGGLPAALLAKKVESEFYREWLDSYFARDVQELFRLRSRSAFLKLLELVLRQSGGLLEVGTLAKHTGVSRPSVTSWLEVLQVTHVLHLIRPFAGGRRHEILAQPKAYGFDTGFVCHTRGWEYLRNEDRGQLWEHIVLETLRSIPLPDIRFWRDKQQREIDFVLPRGRTSIDAIECKWNADAFEVRNLAAFRAGYPRGRNFVVCPELRRVSERKVGTFDVVFLPVTECRNVLA